VIAIGAYLLFRPCGPSGADKVADCLQKSGATVTERRLLGGGEGLPRQIKNRLLEVEKRNLGRARPPADKAAGRAAGSPLDASLASRLPRCGSSSCETTMPMRRPCWL